MVTEINKNSAFMPTEPSPLKKVQSATRTPLPNVDEHSGSSIPRIDLPGYSRYPRTAVGKWVNEKWVGKNWVPGKRRRVALDYRVPKSESEKQS